jgi:hypothetical protein
MATPRTLGGPQYCYRSPNVVRRLDKVGRNEVQAATIQVRKEKIWEDLGVDGADEMVLQRPGLYMR